jgi:hypothetical protein
VLGDVADGVSTSEFWVTFEPTPSKEAADVGDVIFQSNPLIWLENNLKQYGYSYKAVGWKETDALKRYEIMTNLFFSDKKNL